MARDGWGTLMKNGKMIFKGAKRGVISGAKTLDDVAKRLAKKFRFKKFKIAIKNKRFKLYGEFNPWVLLADGKVDFFDQKDLKNVDTPGGTVRLGNKVKVGRKEGVVVGVDSSPSKYVQDLKDPSITSKNKAIGEFRDLKKKKHGDRLKAIRKSEGTAELRRGIPGLQPKDFQAHHVIPREVGAEFDDFFKKIGFNIENGRLNGIMIPPDKDVLKEAIKNDSAVKGVFGNSAFHKGSHPDYTKQIRNKIKELQDDFDMIPSPTSSQKKFFLDEIHD